MRKAHFPSNILNQASAAGACLIYFVVWSHVSTLQEKAKTRGIIHALKEIRSGAAIMYRSKRRQQPAIALICTCLLLFLSACQSTTPPAKGTASQASSQAPAARQT